jgi:hypothetical protein
MLRFPPCVRDGLMDHFGFYFFCWGVLLHRWVLLKICLIMFDTFLATVLQPWVIWLILGLLFIER